MPLKVLSVCLKNSTIAKGCGRSAEYQRLAGIDPSQWDPSIGRPFIETDNVSDAGTGATNEDQQCWWRPNDDDDDSDTPKHEGYEGQHKYNWTQTEWDKWQQWYNDHRYYWNHHDEASQEEQKPKDPPQKAGTLTVEVIDSWDNKNIINKKTIDSTGSGGGDTGRGNGVTVWDVADGSGDTGKGKGVGGPTGSGGATGSEGGAKGDDGSGDGATGSGDTGSGGGDTGSGGGATGSGDGATGSGGGATSSNTADSGATNPFKPDLYQNMKSPFEDMDAPTKKSEPARSETPPKPTRPPPGKAPPPAPPRARSPSPAAAQAEHQVLQWRSGFS